VNDGERVLRELTARNPERLLEELGELARRIRAGEGLRRPRVTLHLRSARDLSGFVLDVGREGSTASVLLHTPPEWNVAHVPMAAIEAVTVHDVLDLSRPPSDAAPAPSRLELRRRLAGAESTLSVQTGAPMPFTLPEPLDEDHLEALGALVPVVTQVLEDVARDETGRTSLVAKVKRIQLAVGDAPHVTLVGDALTIMTVASHNKRLAAAGLKRAVEAAL
jgi:hypothetical protein